MKKQFFAACVATSVVMMSNYVEAAPIKMKTDVQFSPQTIQIVKKSLENKATWAKLPTKVNLCVFAPGGTAAQGLDYATQFIGNAPQLLDLAAQFGVKMSVEVRNVRDFTVKVTQPKLGIQHVTDVKINVYSDERVVTEDFKNKRCDGMAVSTLRARQFNNYVGSIDAVGAVESYKQLQEVISVLSKPEMASKMVNQDYEITGIMPLGAAYIMVRDRAINTLAKAAGKKVAVLDFDKSQQMMVQRMGAQPVSAELSNISGKFNNGQVDIMAAPALLFQPFELYKGMTDSSGKVKGAIVRFPVVQVTGVLMMHRNRFPDGLGQVMREFTSQQLNLAFNFIDQAEREIDNKYWMDIPEADKPGYRKLMREARLAMTEEGYYNKDMMKLLKAVRCKMDRSRYECALTDE